MARNPTAAQKAALRELLEVWEPRIGRAFIQAVYRARSAIDMTRLLDALERGDVAAAVDQLRLDSKQLSPLREAVRGAYMAGGESVHSSLPRVVAATFGFDGYNPRAQAWIENHGANLVQGISEDSRVAARKAVLRVLEGSEGGGLKKTALDLAGRVAEAGSLRGQRVGGILGLSAPMTDEVMTARAILSNPQRLREYFIVDPATGTIRPRYKRADKIFVRKVAKAWRDGRALSEAEIQDGMVRHKNKLLKRRGEAVAQHEAFTARAESREEAMQQVLDRPDVEDVTRRWQLGFPREHRLNHVAIEGHVVSLNERFDLGNGLQARCPHDSGLPISETAGCRCSCVYRVKLKGSTQ